MRTQQSCRMKMSHCAWSEIQVCPQRENAAVFYRMHLLIMIEIHVFLRVDCDPSVPPAFLCALIYRAVRDRSSRFARTCLCAHGERSMCLRCETAAVLGRMISLCARRKFHGFFAYAGRNAGDTFGYGEGRTEHERSSP